MRQTGSHLLTKRLIAAFLGLTIAMTVLTLNASLSYLHHRSSNISRPLVKPLLWDRVQGQGGRWVVIEGNTTIHVGTEANPHNFSYIHNPSSSCLNWTPDLLILVESSVNHFERRRTIRETWGLPLLQKASGFLVRFMLGGSSSILETTLVKAESIRYGDVIQEDFKESFYNLTLKSIMGLKWATKFCPQARFILKTDDDIFIHVLNLLNLLHQYQEEAKEGDLLLCHENTIRKIIRKERFPNYPKLLNKYAVSEKVLPGAYFPPYCAGLGYVMSPTTAKKLYAAALVTPYFFIEDVFVTGFCRVKSGVELVDHPGFNLHPPVDSISAKCAFLDERITSQEVTDKEMRMIWAEVNSQPYFCPRVVGLIK